MRNDPFSRSPQGPQRRGLFGNIRWWVLLLAAGYAVFYWFSNRTVDPYTGEKVMIDSSLDARQETALGCRPTSRSCRRNGRWTPMRRSRAMCATSPSA
jgi:hypothetical protein